MLTDQTVLPIAQLQVPRTSVDSVYGQIITDLTESANLFANGASGEAGRATEGAVEIIIIKKYI